jgi:hypothetical protein
MSDFASAVPRLVHRTAHVRLRLTRRQVNRCYRLLRSAGDVWAWLLDSNRLRRQQGERPVTGYRALCRELTRVGPFGELSVTGRGRCCAATATPGSRPPSAAVRRTRPGSRAANAAWSRCGATTPRSCWMGIGCGCRSPAASRRCGCGWPARSGINRAGPGGHPAGRWWAAVAGGHRRGAGRAP